MHLHIEHNALECCQCSHVVLVCGELHDINKLACCLLPERPLRVFNLLHRYQRRTHGRLGLLPQSILRAGLREIHSPVPKNAPENHRVDVLQSFDVDHHSRFVLSRKALVRSCQKRLQIAKESVELEGCAFKQIGRRIFVATHFTHTLQVYQYAQGR